MLRITDLRLPLDHPPEDLRRAVVARLGIDDDRLLEMTVHKRSYDARKKSAIVLTYTVDCAIAGDEAAVLAAHPGDSHLRAAPDMAYRFVATLPADFAIDSARRPIVVGFGPCGIFCALVLAQMGLRPIVLERGKAVRERTRDTWGLWRKGVLDPESNVQFGEGGAGTFSDGKLWSQISDPRHLSRKVLDEFVKAGAPDEILYVGKPHIGTFRLVGVVEKMRAEIEALGGEIRFGQRVTDLLIEDGHVRGVTVASAAAPERHVDRGRAGRPRARPQRARHLRGAARARRLSRSEAVLDRLSDRAPAVADRPRALRPERRPSAARRRRLPPRPPREERPLGLQLLHVSGRHRGRGDVGGGPGRHQRHEPVLAQRAQCERRHRRRHHAGRLPRARLVGRRGRAARRHRVPAPLGIGRVRARRRRLPRARSACRRFPRRVGPRPRSVPCCRRTSPVCT